MRVRVRVRRQVRARVSIMVRVRVRARARARARVRVSVRMRARLGFVPRRRSARHDVRTCMRVTRYASLCGAGSFDADGSQSIQIEHTMSHHGQTRGDTAVMNLDEFLRLKDYVIDES